MENRRLLVVSLVVLVVAGGLAGFFLLRGGALNLFSQGASLPDASGDFVYREVDPPKDAPNFTLTDQNGEEVSLSEYEDGIVILAFWYADCTHSCKINAFTVARLAQRLGEEMPQRDVTVLGVTLDPEVDNQTKRRWFVETFLEEYGGRMFYLGGEREEVSTVWEEYDVYVEKIQISEYLETYNLTRQELVELSQQDLNREPHKKYPEEIKEQIMDSVHRAITEYGYIVQHKDVIFIMDHGEIKYQVLGHDIDPDKFFQLLNYVANN